LRHIELSDADFILELLNTADWKKYIGDRGLDSISKTEDYLNSIIIPHYQKFGFGFYIVEARSDRTRLGICGLIKRDGLEDVDIGYGFLPLYYGKGYAMEAAQAILEHGFKAHGLKRLVAITVKNNHASISLLKKLGMSHEKMVKLPDDDTELMLFAIESND